MARYAAVLRATALLGLLLLIPTLGFAQASITGTVKDNTGGALPGVTVEAQSAALIEKTRTVFTDAAGVYRLVDLRPGAYKVVFNLTGFSQLIRDGITITGTGTTTVNVEMKIGSLEETLTVSGEAPIVDVSSQAREQVVNRDLLNSIPTGRQMWTVAITQPGISLNAQDVGGAGGLQQTRMRAFGAEQQEVTAEVDGILMNTVHSGGSTQQYFNDGMTQEMSIQTGAMGAETQTGGVRVNMIPQTGGNSFHGSVVAVSVPSESFQSDNLTDKLRAAGLTSVNSVHKIHDFNFSLGGPFAQDKVWFFASNRDLVGDTRWPNVDYLESNRIYQGSGRVTYQATTSHKITGFYEWAHKTKSSQTPGIGRELVTTNERTGIDPYEVAQLKWTGTAGSRLMFEAGWGYSSLAWNSTYHEGLAETRGTPEWYAKTLKNDRTLGTWWNSGIIQQNNLSHRQTLSSSATYVTGSHNIKVGGQWSFGPLRTIEDLNGDLYQEYQNGVPSSVLVYNTPLDSVAYTSSDSGAFAQDSWRLKRLTLNLGVRYDYFSSYIPEASNPAGRFVPARHFERYDSPTFKDFVPRLNVSYDVFGDGKTAIKAGFSKFVNRMTAGTLVNPYNPLYRTTDRRTWNDLNRDDIAQDNEIGPVNSSAFGARRAQLPDPNMKRPFNRLVNVSFDRQVMPGFMVGVGYYHRTYHNLLSPDNLLVSPADYTARQIANPLGGAPLTIYNLAVAKRADVDIRDVNDPDRKIIYDAIDVNFQLRLPGGKGRLIGGFTSERQQEDTCSLDDPNNRADSSATTSCKQTALDIPFQTQAKLTGYYPLPFFGLEVSGVFMRFPGALAETTYQVTRTISPGLTQTSINVPLAPAGTKYQETRSQLDFGLAKSVSLSGGKKIRVQLDLFNALNSSTVQNTLQVYGPNLDKPSEVLVGRLIRLGAQFHF